MGSKKVRKDCKPKSRTSPRKQKTARDVEPEEESQEQSQKPSQEPEPSDELPEGDAAAHGDGDGEKTEKVGTVWTPEQDEQIVAFFEDNTLFYDMAIIMSASYLYHVLCCFLGVICVLCSHRNSVFYVSDHKAWAHKIFRRFQSCHTDYKKINNNNNN